MHGRSFPILLLGVLSAVIAMPAFAQGNQAVPAAGATNQWLLIT